MGFPDGPVVTYVCESWTVKKARHQRIYASELWCWRRLLKVSWTAKIKSVNLKGNQPWIPIGRTDAESKAPVFWSLDANSRLTRKVPDAGKDWGQKEKRASKDEMAGCYHHAVNMNLGKLRKTMRDREVWSAVVHVVAKSRTRLGDWTTTMKKIGLPWWLCDNLPANAGNTGFIHGSGRSPGEGNGNLLPYSCLENPKDKGAWPTIVHGSQKSPTWLND